MNKIMYWINLIFKELIVVGSYLFTIYTFVKDKGNTSNIVIATVVFMIILGYSVSNIYKEYKKRPKQFKNSDNINKFMYDWIMNGGKVTIVSSDMSWIENDKDKEGKLFELLSNKAKANELQIFVSQVSEKVKELKANGAKVSNYGELNYVPESRFTMIDCKKMSSAVAIGMKNQDRIHEIHTYDKKNNPEYALSNDIVSLLESIEEKNDG